MGAKDNRLNYRAGQTAVLQLATLQDGTSYVLQLPDGNRVRQSLVPGKDEVIVTTTDQPGNYRLQAGGERGWLDRGFSVNAPPDVGRLERADPEALRQQLRPDQVLIARNQNEIEIRVGLGRRGRELFPWLICIVAVVLGVEHLLANRFYQNT